MGAGVVIHHRPGLRSLVQGPARGAAKGGAFGNVLWVGCCVFHHPPSIDGITRHQKKAPDSLVESLGPFICVRGLAVTQGVPYTTLYPFQVSCRS